MSSDGGRTTNGSDVSRLVYGYAGGRRRGPRHTAMAVGAARQIDQAMGLLRLTRPVVLVSGFWRSGTTWLQESLAVALAAKTVFEPLAPMEPYRRSAVARLYPDDSEDLCQATVPGPHPDDGAFWSALDWACTGRRANAYLMSCRRTVSESFRRRIVVKDVRLQANLAIFHARYRAPVLHVRRHPCAVAASLVAADWHWSFARAPLDALLSRLGPALSAPDCAVALRFDTDLLSRIAVFWAVTERLAAAALQGHRWGIVLPYERFAADPEAVLAAACDRLGLQRRDAVDFTTPSATVDPAAFAAYGAPPQDRWRRQLSDAEIGRIEAIADALHPAWRDDPADPPPRHLPDPA